MKFARLTQVDFRLQETSPDSQRRIIAWREMDGVAYYLALRPGHPSHATLLYKVLDSSHPPSTAVEFVPLHHHLGLLHLKVGLGSIGYFFETEEELWKISKMI